MARKRLSDLLRDEAGRSPEGDDAQKAGARSPGRQRASNRKLAQADNPIQDAAAALESLPDVNQLHATIAELKATIEALHSELATARQSEESLRKQLTDLETTLHNQNEKMHRLQADLEIAHDHAELEEAKQLILTLSEHNLRLTEERDALKRDAAQPAQPRLNTATESLRRILQHPIAVELPSTTLTDAEIGWVD